MTRMTAMVYSMVISPYGVSACPPDGEGDSRLDTAACTNR
jgi:hypothetical protein